MSAIKNFLKLFIPDSVLKARRENISKRELAEWEKQGCPVPPPHIVKQKTIKEYQAKYNCGVLVETGTFMGEMVDAQKSTFKKVFSIELATDLFNKAVERFKKDENVKIVQGDSGKVLPKVLSEINEPAIFWLDGHYSAGPTAKGDKDCPIFEELDSIFNAKKLNHVILIDDARHFVGEGDYPSVEKLTEYVKNKNDKYKVEVKHDIIRFTV